MFECVDVGEERASDSGCEQSMIDEAGLKPLSHYEA